MSNDTETSEEAEAAEQRVESQKAADPIDDVHIGPLLLTTIICTTAAVLGHVLLGLNYRYWSLPWEPIAGASLSIVAIASFGGFYIASRRARIAIAASFLLTFLVLLTLVITIKQVAEVTGAEEGLVYDFRIVVQTIVGFYFGTELVVSASKVIAVARTGGSPTAVRRADRDLA